MGLLTELLKEGAKQIDVFVDTDAQADAATKWAEHEGHNFPDADVRILVAPGTNLVKHEEKTNTKAVWYYNSAAKSKAPKKARPQVEVLPPTSAVPKKVKVVPHGPPKKLRVLTK